MMKNKIIKFIAVVVSIALLIPVKVQDDFSITYKAILYKVTNYHPIDIEGIEINILGIEIFNNVKPVGLLFEDK